MKDEERLRIILLVEELFANTVNHGYGGDSCEPVWLSLRVEEKICRVVYEDRAPPYNPFTGATGGNTEGGLDHRPVGGLGIVLLIELSTSRCYERRGERNVIELNVPRALPHHVS